MTDPQSPPADGLPTGAPPEGYPALRKAGLALGLACVAFLVFYYPIVPMLLHSVIPLVALAAVGFVLGLVTRRRLFLLCFFLWWLVLMASILRRSALATVPLASQIFDGALLGYPTWAVWLAQGFRYASYFLALWAGGRLARRLKGAR